MNNESDKEKSVSKAYRTFSDETAPADLDRAVLREAGAGRASGFWSRFYTWRRPLAFAATLVLGVTLVYDMQTALQQSGTPYLPAPEIFEDNTPRSDQATGERIAPASVREEESPAESAARDAAAPAANGVAARKFSAPPAAAVGAEPKAMSLQQQGFTDNESREEQRALPQLLERTRSKAAIAAQSAADASTSVTADACNDARFESAQRWWDCVEQLRTAGEITQADAELRNLQQQFPDFRSPPSLD